LFGLTNASYAFIILNMRTLWRTSLAAWPRDAALLRDVGLVGLADGIVGLSFGAAAVAGGLPWWVPVAMSLIVFAGGSQIAAVGVVLAGGSPLAAVAAGAVLNTRLFPYGLAVADVVTSEYGAVRRWLIRVIGAHLITDEAVAFALRQDGRAGRRTAFWTCGIGLFVIWNVSVLLGVGLGAALHDTNALGLDSTFPAVMLALALPTLTSRPIRVAAGAGAVIAVALTPLLPAGLPLLAALGGLGTRWQGWRRLLGRPSRPGGGAQERDGGSPRGDDQPRDDGQPDAIGQRRDGGADDPSQASDGRDDAANDDEMTVGGRR
jgi:predicted branched-subunit amino acid permease